MDKRPIGVFDSGLGGLTVLKEIQKVLPNEDIIYFGDTKRVPYGCKSEKEVLKYTIEAIEFFKEKNVKAIVIACNTATVIALKKVKEDYSIPILGVVKPGARSVVRISENKKVLVLATEGTVKSKGYEKEILNIDSGMQVISKACPSFVPLVESGMSGTNVAYCKVRENLQKFKNIGIDSIVLGCTHYPYLEQEIQEFMGRSVNIINPAIETAQELRGMLESMDLLNENYQCNNEFYVSGNPQEFKDLAQEIIDVRIEFVDKISIEKYEIKGRTNK